MGKSVRQKLKRELEAKSEKKRRFRGWKANLVAQTEEFSVNVPIRYQKITSQAIDQAMNIITKSRSLGVEVQRKLLGDYHYGYVTENGEEVQKEDLAYYQVLDGKEREVQPFDKTKGFDITNFIAKEKLWGFLLENFYEIWSEKNGLWLLADYLQRQNKLAVCDHIVLRKSFKEYYGLIFPVILEDKYTLVMVLTRMNLQYEHLKPAKPIVEPQKPIALTPKSVLKVDLFGKTHK